MSAALASRREPTRTLAEEPLISIGEAALDRMPALTLIYEQTAANFTRALEEVIATPAALSLGSLDAMRLADLGARHAELTEVFVYEANGLSSKAAVAVDKAFCGLCVELLLGSAVADAPSAVERAISRIDRSLTAFALSKLLEGFATALTPAAKASFARDASAEEAGLAALGQKSSVAIVALCRLASLEREGVAAFILPRAALDPFREALAKFPGAEGLARDERWSENLYDHVVRTQVKVDVKIEARGYTLGDMARLEIGDVLRLPLAPQSPIRVESDGRTLFWCTLGQKDGHYTVRLEDFSTERQSIIENILGV